MGRVKVADGMRPGAHHDGSGHPARRELLARVSPSFGTTVSLDLLECGEPADAVFENEFGRVAWSWEGKEHAARPTRR